MTESPLPDDPDAAGDSAEDSSTDKREHTATDDQPPEPPDSWLAQASAEWVEDGIISTEQARAIRERHGLTAADPPLDSGDRQDSPAERDSSTQRRIVRALSLMGAGLVGVGLLAALSEQWDAIPHPVRLLILLATTATVLGSGGVLRHRRGRPVAGHALLALGTVAVGVALFGIDDLYGPALPAELLFSLWGVAGLAIAHRTVSPQLVGLSFGPVGAAVATTVSGSPVVHVGLVGIGVVGVGSLMRWTRWEQLGTAYRLAGLVGTLGAILFVLFDDVALDLVAPNADAWLAVSVFAAVLGTVTTGLAVSRDRSDSPWLTWSAVAGGVLVLTIVVSLAAPQALSALVRSLVWNALTLGVVLCTVWLGYTQRSPLIVNGAVVAFLLQLLLVLASSIVGETAPSVALIVSGTILLVVGVALERGRRALLEQMSPAADHAA